MRWIEAVYGEVAVRVPMDKQPVSIGRSSNCDFAFPADKEVSRLHAVLEPRENGWFLVDQKSTNGSFVNGQRVTVPWPIKDGDNIEIGEQKLKICTANDLTMPKTDADHYAGYPHHYMVLRVHPSADMAEILRSYGELRTIFRHESHAESDMAKRCLAEVEEAFAVVGDIKKRKDYDATMPPRWFLKVGA